MAGMDKTTMGNQLTTKEVIALAKAAKLRIKR